MALIVGVTGAAALLFSFLMLQAGLGSMGIRYPLAVGLAYGVFLLLLRLWLSYATSSEGPNPGDGLLDVADGLGQLAPDVANAICEGGSGGVNLAETGDALSLDEFVFVLIAFAAVAAGALICAYIVWTAPGLLAEVMVDGLVMSRVFRRLRLRGQAYWATGVLRRTWLPALLAALFFGIAGFALQRVVPEAQSIGPVIESLLS